MADLPSEKIKTEIYSTGGGCVSVDFDSRVEIKDCWLCGVKAEDRCCLNAMREQTHVRVDRDWLYLYATEREAARG